MTGYGEVTHNTSQFQFEVRLKVVNHRYFLLNINSPREYQHLDSEIQKRVKKHIFRGSVDLSIYTRHSKKNRDLFLQVNEKGAKKWLEAYKKTSKNLGLKGDISIKDILEQDGVVTLHKKYVVKAKEKKIFFSILNKVLSHCDAERSREGKALQKNIKDLLEKIQKIQKKMEQERKKKVISLKKNQKKPKEGMRKTSYKDRAALLEKTDIEEELQRLKTHIRYCKLLLNKKNKGKKIDFYSQELLREINTIGSKCEFVELTKLVVEAKGFVEQIREQVQNVE